MGKASCSGAGTGSSSAVDGAAFVWQAQDGVLVALPFTGRRGAAFGDAWGRARTGTQRRSYEQ